MKCHKYVTNAVNVIYMSTVRSSIVPVVYNTVSSND